MQDKIKQPEQPDTDIPISVGKAIVNVAGVKEEAMEKPKDNLSNPVDSMHKDE